MLAAAALVPPKLAEACSGPPIPEPKQLVEEAGAIIHVRVLGLCSELTGPCAQLARSIAVARPAPTGKPFAPGGPPIAVSRPATTDKPYAPGWPPIAVPRRRDRHAAWREDGKLLAVEVVAVLKGQPVSGRFAIRGDLVTHDNYNDRNPPYAAVRSDGLGGSCFARTYKRDAEYLLLLTETDDVLTPYWSALAPTNEQVRSKDDPWIKWVREQLARK